MPYTIALIFERKSHYRSIGFSEDECEELSADEEIDALVLSLRSLGHTVHVVGDIKDLVACLARDQHCVWDLVFSVSEGIYGHAREAQVPALLEAYQIAFIGTDAASTVLCHDKAKTKMMLEHYSIPTPPWCLIPKGITGQASSGCEPVASVVQDYCHASSLTTYPLFVKPAADGTSRGIHPHSKVTAPSELEAAVSLLYDRYPDQDVLIESFLAGREFTVAIVGTGSSARVVGVLEFCWDRLKDETRDIKDRSDFFTIDLKKNEDGSMVEARGDSEGDPEVQKTCEIALDAYRKLGCRDYGRIDMRSDKKGLEASPCVIEINTKPGLYPDWSHMAIIAGNEAWSYQDLVQAITDSALRRVGEERKLSNRSIIIGSHPLEI